jgi:hypothetical protein
MEKTYLIHPSIWEKIWVYGLEIIGCGFDTCNEFWGRSTRIPRYSQDFNILERKKNMLGIRSKILIH